MQHSLITTPNQTCEIAHAARSPTLGVGPGPRTRVRGLLDITSYVRCSKWRVLLEVRDVAVTPQCGGIQEGKLQAVVEVTTQFRSRAYRAFASSVRLPLPSRTP